MRTVVVRLKWRHPKMIINHFNFLNHHITFAFALLNNSTQLYLKRKTGNYNLLLNQS